MPLFHLRHRAAMHSAKPRRRHHAAVSAEVLEDRTMLTGLVMDESVFNPQLFGQNIEEQIPIDPFGPNGVAGLSYAIIDGDPEHPISNAVGLSRLPQDGILGGVPIAKSAQVPQAIASTAKPMTATVILHLLQQQVIAEKGISADLTAELQEKLDQNIVDFLPETWGPGVNGNGPGWAQNFNQITIRELLQHTSGLLGTNNPATGGVDSTPGSFYSGGGNRYNYSGLQQIAENGIVNANVNGDGTTSWPADYWTTNYSWFRVMLPYMWDEISNNELDLNAQGSAIIMSALAEDDGIAEDLRNAIEEDWGIESTGNDNYTIAPGQLTSTIFKYYLTRYLLEPAGVVNPQVNSSGPAPTLFYPLVPGNTPGVDPSDPASGPLTIDIVGNQLLNLGPRSLFLSSEDHTRVITAIRHGAVSGAPILLPATRDLMEGENLGWGTGNPSGLFGTYYDHGGGNFRPAATQPVMNNTYAMAFPNGVEVTTQINSQIQLTSSAPTVVGAAFNPTATPTTTTEQVAIINAYENAWTDLVYDGDDLLDGLGNEHDTFRLARNANPLYIDFFHDNMTTPVFTRRIDTLDTITINGLDGTNVYQLFDLPASIEVVINGGSQYDVVTVGIPASGVSAGDLDQFAPGTLTFNGGTGYNELNINDNGNGNPLGEFYIIRDDEVIRSGAGVYGYHNVNTLNVVTSNFSDDVFVLGTHPATTTNVDTDTGPDNVTIGNTAIDFVLGQVNLLNSVSDTVRFADTSSDTGHTYDVDSDRTVIDGSVTVTYSAFDLEIDTGNGNDTIDVDSLWAAQDLDITTGLGENEINLNLLSNPLETSVLGEITVHGGTGDNDTLTVNDGTSLLETSYTITGESVDRPGIQTIEYDGIDELNVNGAISASSYDIESTSAATNVNAGIFGDTFNVGVAALNLIDGELSIDGGDLSGTGGSDAAGEDDVVNLNDGFGSSWAYVIQNDVVLGNGFAAITLDDIEQATLDASSLNNVVHIVNSYFDTRYTVNGHAGDDWFYLATTSRDLTDFNNPVVVNGGFGDNHLVLYDDLTLSNHAYTVTDNSVDRLLFGEFGPLPPQGVGVTFSDMVDVELVLNNQDNTVNVQSTNPDTRYLFYGQFGSDTLNLNRHLDDTTDANILIDGADITGKNIDIEYHNFAQLNVTLGEENTRVAIEDLHSDADLKLGAGNDRLLVTPTSRNLTNISRTITVDGEGGYDRLILNDSNNPFGANYTITPTTIDRFLFGPFPGSEPGATYENIEFVRLFMTAHDDIANINGTNPGTRYDVRGRRGNDTFYVNQPPASPVTLLGGNGVDSVDITGTRGDDEVSISYGTGTADVNLVSIEVAGFNGLTGDDALVYQGIAGVDEDVSIHASTTAGSGTLSILAEDVESDALDLAFENTEFLDLLANCEDDDTAAFHGTVQRDWFDINLTAEGTNTDPVLKLRNRQTGAQLLALRDYENFDRLSVLGGDAADRFDVLVGPTGPSARRDLLIDGGSPSGRGKPRDVLNVFFQTPRPKITKSYNPNLDEGFIDLEYDHYRFFIELENIERARLKRV